MDLLARFESETEALRESGENEARFDGSGENRVTNVKKRDASAGIASDGLFGYDGWNRR